MMKFLMFTLFLIPVCLLNSFWVILYCFFIVSFGFMNFYCLGFDVSLLSYFLGVDILSFSLVLLSFWICALMILASEKIFKAGNYEHFFLLVMVFLLLSLFMTFSSLNLFMFYLFFEVSLIPTLILIIGWGYQPERIEAGVYLLFYTLLVSLPMMIFIFFYYESFFTLEFFLMCEDLDNLFWYLCSIMVFLVKIPIYFLHLWLPKAHVEAPVSGSMILAGIMLKLGGYGLIRLLSLFMSIGLKMNLLFILFSLFGGIIVSLVCVRQSDIKSLIAYSSVAHMGMALSGILTFSVWGITGSLVMMIAHGLCSSGLFCLANLVYERFGSRSLYLNKGLLNVMPSMSLWWFLLCSSNMAAPPSLNLLGEIMLINSLVYYNYLSMLSLSLMSFLSAVYSLFLFSFSQHGQLCTGSYSFVQSTFREYLLMFLHWVPLNVLILKSDLLVW